MTRSLTLVALMISLLTGVSLAADAPRKPNIILIMADDLGYETLGCNGSLSYKTPVLDKLAAEGVRFDRCYSQPLCTPTRVQLMTGQYNVRNYTRFGVIEPGQTTFAHLLKQAGYATAVAGKWQLGQDVELPKKLGFDEHCLWQHTRRPPRFANPGLEINGKQMDYKNGEYGPDLVNDYALDFVQRKKDGPFFLYYPMILTHDPFQPTPDSKNWDPKAIGEGVNRSPDHFKDMVQYMDKLIGKLVTKLDELKLRENTLILFLGDNGTGVSITTQTKNGPIKGGKGKTTAAGTHVPMVASWPAGISGGRVCDDLIDTTDYLPTLLDAAGVAKPAALTLDGTSFLPQLKGEKGTPRQWIYVWYAREGGPTASGEFAMDKRFKLYRTGKMFDVSKDVLEEKPLDVAGLDGEAKAAREVLQKALDKYGGPRPEAIVKQGGKAGKAGNADN